MQREQYQQDYKRLSKNLKEYLQKLPKKRGRGANRHFISDEQLLRNYVEIKHKLGRTPLGVELEQHGRYHSSVYQSHFGSYRQFLEILGEELPDSRPVPPPLPRPITTMELLLEFRRVMRALGRVPTWDDLQQKSSYHSKDYKKVFVNTKKIADFIERRSDLIEQVLEDHPHSFLSERLKRKK